MRDIKSESSIAHQGHLIQSISFIKKDSFKSNLNHLINVKIKLIFFMAAKESHENNKVNAFSYSFLTSPLCHVTEIQKM